MRMFLPGEGSLSVTVLWCALSGLVLESAGSARELPGSSPPRIEVGELTMLAIERETLANQLAVYVAHHLLEAGSGPEKTWARRLLRLALTLHPENPRARAVEDALLEKTSPPPLQEDYSAEVLSRLLYHRAQQLRQGTASDQSLAPYLLGAAAWMTPYFEDAVYFYEKERLRGRLSWEHLLAGASSPGATDS